MKVILIFLISISLFGNDKWVKKEYNQLSNNQKRVIIESYEQGKSLKINNHTYGYTIASFVLLESSARNGLLGDDSSSAGLTQFTIRRARELLKTDYLQNRHYVFKMLEKVSDKRLKHILKVNDIINREFCMANFEENYKRWHSYKEAIKAHNGYNPKKGFYNEKYWNKFKDCLRVVKMVINKRRFK